MLPITEKNVLKMEVIFSIAQNWNLTNNTCKEFLCSSVYFAELLFFQQ